MPACPTRPSRDLSFVGHLCVLPSSIPRCVSRPRSTALHRATGRSRGAAAARGGGGGAKRAFIFPIDHGTLGACVASCLSKVLVENRHADRAAPCNCHCYSGTGGRLVASTAPGPRPVECGSLPLAHRPY